MTEAPRVVAASRYLYRGRCADHVALSRTESASEGKWDEDGRKGRKAPCAFEEDATWCATGLPPGFGSNAVADLITICIPTYRRPSLLLYCLHTCFAQDYRPLEIDIGDNSPGVDTQELLRSVTLPPSVTLRYRRHDPPLGPIGNVAYLFAEARGRRLILMHDDDALLPGAVSALDQAFGLAPDVVAAYGMLEVINAAGEYLHADTERDNVAARRTPDQAGLRRDMLVCALSRQFPPNGFLISTEAARRVGYRDRAEIGLAADTDFGIRLAQAYSGGAFAFINRTTSRYRVAPSSQRFNEPDTCWKFYDAVRRMEGLTPEEEEARDWTLSHIARAAMLEHAMGRRRRAALEIFLSRHYPRPESLGRTLHALGMIAMPRTFHALRRVIGILRPDLVMWPEIPTRLAGEPGRRGHLLCGAIAAAGSSRAAPQRSDASSAAAR